MEPIRLQKYLAEKGYASRRGAEKLIAEGLVRVNGAVITEMGVKVDPDKDQIEVDQKALQQKATEKAVLALNKPTGYVTTKAENEGPNVMELIKGHPRAAQMNAAGRLDKDSCGLVLLTNDGELQYRLMAPESHLEKEYEVVTVDPVYQSQLEKFEKGMIIEGEPVRPAQARRLGKNRLRIIITEGKNRQVRKMCQKVGLRVSGLKRVRIGPLWLPEIPERHWIELSRHQRRQLEEALQAAAMKVPHDQA